jgi:hypothetical protein
MQILGYEGQCCVEHTNLVACAKELKSREYAIFGYGVSITVHIVIRMRALLSSAHQPGGLRKGRQ